MTGSVWRTQVQAVKHLYLHHHAGDSEPILSTFTRHHSPARGSPGTLHAPATYLSNIPIS